MSYGIAFEFLDMGMGDGTLIQLPPWDRGGVCLFDFGEKGSPFKNPSSDATKFAIERISEVCKNAGLLAPQLEYLFISHADGDHWNKLEWLIEGDLSSQRPGEDDLWHTIGGYPPGTFLSIKNLVYGGTWTKDYEGRNEYLADLIWNQSTNHIALANGDFDAPTAGTTQVNPRWTWKPGVAGQETKIYLLSSNLPAKAGADCNPKSLVLLFEYGKFKIILSGDAESRIVEPAIIARYEGTDVVPVTALKLGHHGSAASTSEAYVDVLEPDIIFASGDKRWGHPYCNAINRGSKWLTNGDPRWYACSASGADNDYDNTDTAENICMNLWYVVTNPAGTTLNDITGASKSAPFGTYTGVQWRLQFDSNSANPFLSWVSETGWPAP
jgi:hypothetical protein